MKGRFVYSTKEVLQIARVAEAEALNKKTRKQQQKRLIVKEVVKDKDNEVLEDFSSKVDF